LLQEGNRQRNWIVPSLETDYWGCVVDLNLIVFLFRLRIVLIQ